MVPLGTFSRPDKAGANSFHFTGRVSGHALKPGPYAFTAQPRAGGKIGKTATVRFHVIR
jgi:hypothetical protein